MSPTTIDWSRTIADLQNIATPIVACKKLLVVRKNKDGRKQVRWIRYLITSSQLDSEDVASFYVLENTPQMFSDAWRDIKRMTLAELKNLASERDEVFLDTSFQPTPVNKLTVIDLIENELYLDE